MLTRVKIERYHCLREIDVKLGPFNVLIGPGDSGKSAFLQALGEPQRAAFGGRVHLAGMPAMKPSVRLYAERTDVWLTLGPAGLVLGSGPHGHEIDAVRSSRIWQRIADKPFMRVGEPLSLDPAAIAAPSPRGSGVLAQLVETRGRGATAHLARAALNNRRRYDAIQRGMYEASGGRVHEALIGEPTDEGYPLSFRLHDGAVVPAGALAQSLLVIFALLCLVHRDDAPAVLLVEQPENGVHPLRLNDVVKLLRSVNERGVQVVMTTSSPDLLDACKPEEVLVFRRPGAGAATEVRRLPAELERRASATMGRIWAADGEEGLCDLLPPTQRRQAEG